MRYRHNNPDAYLKAITRLVVALTGNATDILDAILTHGVHPRGQVVVAHANTSWHRGAVVVEWVAKNADLYRAVIDGFSKDKRAVLRLVRTPAGQRGEPEAKPDTWLADSRTQVLVGGLEAALNLLSDLGGPDGLSAAGSAKYAKAVAALASIKK